MLRPSSTMMPSGRLSLPLHPEGNTTTHKYDLGGRRTDRDHPSAGHTHWDYDAVGNMVLQTQNNGEYIKYAYNYSRPMHIAYSSRPWNNVWYKYGSSGTEAGRVVYQQDATGVQQFHYDFMGNVDTNWHTYVQPHSPNTFTLKTAWRYDSWGRVLDITYPDREKVTYKYDFGGQLYSVDGYKNGIVGHTPYIQEIRYNHFGQRTQVIDGDGVKTTYDYDPATRRLAHLMNYSSVTWETLQDNLYYYDAVGNIDSVRDHGRNHRVQTYKYDDANRLVGSTGSMTQEYSAALPYSYKSNYKYSLAGRLLNKYVDSKRLSTAMGPYTVRYDNEYSYTHPNNPYAVTHIQDVYGAYYDFRWDDNGNLVNSHAHATHTDRRLCWTEDNRLQAFMERSDEGGIAAWYNYSAEGERNIKLTSPRLNMQQNATLFSNPPLVYPTLYASSLVTLTKQGYTKHYFEEGRRICSKIGGGMQGNVTLEEIDSRVPALEYNYEEQHKHQNDGVYQTFHNCLGVDVENTNSVDLHRMLVGRELQRDDNEPAFFYHGDHLGSTAYMTLHGQVYQTLNYLPYGEDWVEYNFFHPADTTRLSIYRFNGKEKDYESGFHYYGARYYWSEVLTGWLSVDPMMDKYPVISPYNYCAWNPMIIVDPNGMDTVTVSFDANKKSYSLNYSKGGDNVIIGPNGESQKFDSDVDVCQYRFTTIGNNEVSAYMVNVKDGEDPIFGFAVERKSTLIDDGSYNMTQNEKSNIDKNPSSTSKNPIWQGYMVFKGGCKFHWGNSTEWSSGCVVAVGNVELGSQINAKGWLTFDLATSQNACYKVTEYFGGKKGDQNYKFWHSRKNKVITRPAVTWGKNQPNCKWDIRSR